MYLLPPYVTIGKSFHKNVFCTNDHYLLSRNHLNSIKKIVVFKQTLDSMYKFEAMKYHIKYHIFTKLKVIVSTWMHSTKIWFCVVNFFDLASHYLANIAQVLFIRLVFINESNIKSTIMNNFANFNAIIGAGPKRNAFQSQLDDQRIGMANSGNFYGAPSVPYNGAPDTGIGARNTNLDCINSNNY